MANVIPTTTNLHANMTMGNAPGNVFISGMLEMENVTSSITKVVVVMMVEIASTVSNTNGMEMVFVIHF